MQPNKRKELWKLTLKIHQSAASYPRKLDLPLLRLTCNVIVTVQSLSLLRRTGSGT